MRRTAELSVYRSAGYKCENPACSHKYPEHALHIHHIIESEIGGRDDFGNLVLLCAQCHNDLHRTGRFTRQDLRAWKASNQNAKRDAEWYAIVDAKSYLKFSLPRDLRRNRNVEIVGSAVPALSALGRNDSAASIRLWLALARAFHRIGDAPTTTLILDRLISGVDSDTLAFTSWPTELRLQAIHLRARSCLQAGDFVGAYERVGEASAIADNADIYGVEISIAEVLVDQLHVLYRQEDDAGFIARADSFKELIYAPRYSIGEHARSIKSQFDLYRGMRLARRDKWEDGERFVISSIEQVSRDNDRGLTIR